MPIVEKGVIQSATQRWKVEPLFDEKIKGLIKLLEYRACRPCQQDRVVFTHFHRILSVIARGLIFANDLPCITVLDGAITVLVSNDTILRR